MLRTPHSSSRRTLALAAALCTAASVLGITVASAQTTTPVPTPAPTTTAPSKPVPAPSAPGTDVTSPAEKALIDAVPAQTLTWATCDDNSELDCASLKVPATWEKPAGELITLKVVRRKAAESSVGYLVTQAGSALNATASFVHDAGDFLPSEFIKRFDLVGLENRGQLPKPALHCLTTFAESQSVVSAIKTAPQSAPEWAKAMEASKTLGEGCATKGKDVAPQLSTWSLARDHEVMRRALGADAKLNFFTAIYGSVLAQTYASMFPDRVRAAVLDAPYDAKSYLGVAQSRTQTESIQSGSALHNVLTGVIQRCEAAGPSKCSFAGTGKGSTWKKFNEVLEAMKTSPIPIGESQTIGYVHFLDSLDLYLQDNDGMRAIMDSAQEAYKAINGTPARPGGALDALRAKAAQREALRTSTRQQQDEYDNTYDSYYAYVCNDHSVSLSMEQIPGEYRRLTKQYPHVGAKTLHEELRCASDVWTIKAAQPFAGTLGKKLALPPLVVSNTYNSHSHVGQAQRIAAAFPGAGMVKGEGVWGVGTSRTPGGCMDKAVEAYMITGILPKGGTVTCKPTWQPFDGSSKPAPPSAVDRGVVDTGLLVRRVR